MNISMLQAGSGDCFFIRYPYDNKHYNIWVDGGVSDTYKEINNHITELDIHGEVIDLLIVTHIDNDHINGVLQFFTHDKSKHSLVKRVLFHSASAISRVFNTPDIDSREIPLSGYGTELTLRQGITLERILKKLGLATESAAISGDKIDLPGAVLHILSPDKDSLDILNQQWETEIGKSNCSLTAERDYNRPFHELYHQYFEEDTNIVNKASIAFLLEQGDKKVLMLADAIPTTIIKALQSLGYNAENPLSADIVKLSHHGSRRNTSTELISMLNCSRYMISSNSNSHPHKEALARVMQTVKNPTFLCNYKKNNILLPDEMELCVIKQTNCVEV